MKVLVACEESQRVANAFRKKGHEAFSCDIIDCSGGHPEWHIKKDVLEIINDGWDLMIAHPPCTRLCCASNRSRKDHKEETEKAIEFFLALANAKIDKICIENPIGIMSTIYKKPSQIIQPWQFAIEQDDLTAKSTCLWLKNLPILVPTNNVPPEIKYKVFIGKNGRVTRQTEWYYATRCLPREQRGRIASKTFNGIANAMATQWG